MQLSKIVSITPDGNAFTTVNGTFYPFRVGFDNHHAGQANSKSNPPPWRVGEIVGYEVTGQTPRGIDKFKITRNPGPEHGQYQPPAGTSEPMPGDPIQPPPRPVPPRSVAQNAPAAPSTVHPATVGCAYNNARELWVATAGAAGASFDPQARAIVKEWASQILADLQELESGNPF